MEAGSIERLTEELFIGRYSALLSHVRHDILEAATAIGNRYWNRPGEVPVRIAASSLLAVDSHFVQMRRGR